MDIREAIIYKNIFGGGGGDGSNAMVEHKLTYNGTAIQLDGATQTFAQVKAACDDAKKFVFLVYENRLYIPQYVYNDRIYFTCTYPTEASGVMTSRITMMSNNTVTVNNTELQPKLTAGENISIVDNVISAAGGGGEQWELISSVSVEEDVGTVEITTDTNGNQFSLKKFFVMFLGAPTPSNGNYRCYMYANASDTDITGECTVTLDANRKKSVLQYSDAFRTVVSSHYDRNTGAAETYAINTRQISGFGALKDNTGTVGLNPNVKISKLSFGNWYGVKAGTNIFVCGVRA